MAQPYVGPHETVLRANAERAEFFLNWRFEFATRGLIEIAWVVPSTGSWAFARFGLNRKKDAATFAATMNADPGKSIYYRSATVEDIGKEWTTDATVAELMGPCVDLDNSGDYERSLTILPLCRPNAMVVTGTHPHTRVQYLWRASAPGTKGILQKGINQRLSELYQSDSMVINDSTYLRLPGMIAWPYKPDRQPELVELFMALDDRPAYYPWHALAAAFPPPKGPEQTRQQPLPPAGATGAHGSPATRHGPANEDGEPLDDASIGLGLGPDGVIANIGAGNRHKSRLYLINNYLSRGWSDGEILRAIEAINWGDTPAEESRRKTLSMIGSGRIKFGLSGAAVASTDAAAQEPPPEELKVVPLEPRPPSAIAPRPWVVPGLLIKGYVTVLAAPPGSGKSLLSAQLAVALAASMPQWGSLRIRRPTTVLLVNAEDDLMEQVRRITAACKVMQVNAPQLEGRLLTAEDPKSICVAQIDQKSGMMMVLPLYHEIVRKVRELGVKVLVVDPFIESYVGNENSNGDISKVASLWRDVARDCGIAVLLIHHTRKGGIAGDVDAIRGGGALIGVVRVAATLYTMSDADATNLGVSGEERNRYVRLDDAKSNMSLMSGEPAWFKKISVCLDNETKDEPADYVGALEPWTPPQPFDGVDATKAAAILDAIARGPGNEEQYTANSSGKPSGKPTADDLDPNSRWVGHLIMRMTDLDATMAGKMVDHWLKEEVLIKAKYKSKMAGRKPAWGLTVNAQKKPGLVVSVS